MSEQTFRVVIPSRYAATRLPGKPLRLIHGKPLVQHVYERARESGASEIVIATDHDQIATVAVAFGADVCMTASELPSGTDRIAAVATERGWSDNDIVVNLQGDEPMLPGSLIRQAAVNLHECESASVSTLCILIKDSEEVTNPNAVKVVFDRDQRALYFSRAPIPWDQKSIGKHDYYRHIGLYAYRVGFLKEYVTMPRGRLEQIEYLEQLRVLESGYQIHVDIAAESPGIGVDTDTDLQAVIELMKSN